MSNTIEGTTMKNTLIIATLAGLFGLAGAALAAETVDRNALQRQKEVFQHRLADLAANPIDPNRLEPCVNGQVSVSGLYPTQAEEDAALADAQRIDQAMSGQVSASER
jgi:hypothetical protein